MDLAEIRKKAQRERAAQVVIPIEPKVVMEEEFFPSAKVEIPNSVVELPAEAIDSNLEAELELEALLEEEERQESLQRDYQAREEAFRREMEKKETLPLPVDDVMHSSVAAVAPVSRPEVVEMPMVPVEQKVSANDPLSLILSGRMAAGIYDDMEGPIEVETEAGDYDQFLCFWLGDEEYAVNIMEIKEIVKPREVTEVPRAPVFVPGIVSLRGVVIPVYDMHLRLGLAKIEETGKERVIVVKKGEELCGLMVDRVSKVVKLTKSVIEQPPVVLDGIDREFVEGLGRYDGGMFILLDLDRVLDISLLKN